MRTSEAYLRFPFSVITGKNNSNTGFVTENFSLQIIRINGLRYPQRCRRHLFSFLKSRIKEIAAAADPGEPTLYRKPQSNLPPPDGFRWAKSVWKRCAAMSKLATDNPGFLKHTVALRQQYHQFIQLEPTQRSLHGSLPPHTITVYTQMKDQCYNGFIFKIIH